MSQPTADEQLSLELINQFRADPDGEFDRLIGADPDVDAAMAYFGVNLSVLRAALEAYDPVAPLAWNSALAAAARGHNDAMIAADIQSHRVPGELGLRDRVEAQGYDNWTVISENTYAYTDGVFFAHAGFVVDWGAGPNGMQDPAGHRIALMRESYDEVGVGVTVETDPSTVVGDVLVTQNFGSRSNYQAKILGVVIDDRDGDDFYDVGEGLGGVTVTVIGGGLTLTTQTFASGGYQLVVPAGAYEITFEGGGLGGVVTQTVSIGDENVKVDARAQDAEREVVTPPEEPKAAEDDGRGAGYHDDGPVADEPDDDAADGDGDSDGDRGGDQGGGVMTGAHLVGDGGANRLVGGRDNDLLEGFASRDSLVGGGGDDTMLGGDGADRLIGYGGDDVADGGRGVDRIFGGDGADTIDGGGGGDSLMGGVGDDSILGGDGGDYIKGEGGDDVVFGGAGSDEVRGDHGDDTVGGGQGTDTIAGGTGADVFYFTGYDGVERVLDYKDGEDKFQIVDRADSFGDLKITQKGADVWIEFGGSRAVLVTENVENIDASDFIF